jgi:hypothetical protein
VGYSGTPYYEQDPTVVAELLERLEATATDPHRRVLLRGATVITMDPDVADLRRGDVPATARRWWSTSRG